MIVFMQSAVAIDNWFRLELQRVPSKVEIQRLITYLQLCADGWDELDARARMEEAAVK